MAKLIDYTADTRFNSDDILIKDGSNGTKKILVANAAVELPSGIASSSKCLQRKKSWTAVTAAQRQPFPRRNI